MSSTHALTLAWPWRIWICLSNSCSVGIGSAVPPYTPLSEIVPPRRTISIAECSAASLDTPAFSISGCGDRVRQQPRQLVGDPGDRRAVRLHADGVDDRVGAAAVGHLADRAGEVVGGPRGPAPRSRGRGRARAAPARGRRRSRRCRGGRRSGSPCRRSARGRARPAIRRRAPPRTPRPATRWAARRRGTRSGRRAGRRGP